ncbi:MAG TPA: rod shape-determining protein MreD, partial [Solirubrobacteraceae bacterium]|nr:rod shape-determining protein MreD [Solirubrobacteraceae bacterium]
MTVSYQLALRIAALAVVATIVEIAAVSQVSVFGVSADLSPLVVMSVGLLTGSMTGAVVGFGVGLFLDLALVQTLGVSSLIYLGVGYWAGRIRE